MKIFLVHSALFLALALAAPAEEEAKPAEVAAKPAEVAAKPTEKENFEKQRAEIEATCRKQSGATDEQIEFFKKEPKSEQPQAVKCHANCIAENFKNSKDGEIEKDVLDIYPIEGIPKEEAEKYIKECSTQKAEDPCEKSYQAYLCLIEKSDKFKI